MIPKLVIVAPVANIVLLESVNVDPAFTWSVPVTLRSLARVVPLEEAMVTLGMEALLTSIVWSSLSSVHVPAVAVREELLLMVIVPDAVTLESVVRVACSASAMVIPPEAVRVMLFVVISRLPSVIVRRPDKAKPPLTLATMSSLVPAPVLLSVRLLNVVLVLAPTVKL